MGNFYCSGNAGFKAARKGEYIDKSGLIAIANRAIGTANRFLCVSRPRRFGKSMAAEMFSAYYDRSCESADLFDDLKIASDDSYRMHLNNHRVIYVDMTFFISTVDGKEQDVVSYVQKSVIDELKKSFPEIENMTNLPIALSEIQNIENDKFVIIIDEWDAVLRSNRPEIREQQDAYIDFLRGLFKSNITNRIIDLAYITGIFPIKKYGTESAMTNFDEYSIVNPGPMAEYMGFRENEVHELCQKYSIDMEKMKCWYDGYRSGRESSIYNPNSVMSAIRFGEFDSYWTRTETFESLKRYIDMDFEGIRERIVGILAGESIEVEMGSFQNSMDSLKSADDVFACLIHLGYLTYDNTTKRAYIPNEEVRREFLLAVKKGRRTELARVINESDELLKATLRMEEDVVASRIADLHETGIAPHHYNREESLRYVIRFAYITCIDEYMRIEELPTGHGYADIVYLPKKDSDYPALVIELKWNKQAEGAIDQIQSKNYPRVLEGYDSEILLIGINYDTETKKHECRIEKLFKG